MFQTRSLTTGFLVASLGIAAAFAVVGSPNLASADAGCAKLKVAEVKAVCDKGGVAAVKKEMKSAMDKANAAKKDLKLECKSCHTDQKEYATNGEAGTKFTDNMAAHFGK